MKHHMLFLLVALLIVVSSCATPSELKKFEALCKSNHHQWMRMTPMIDGEVMSTEACWGCMLDARNHICSEEEYRSSLGSAGMMSDEMSEMHEQMEGMMHGEAMKAHAGMKGSVEVHTFIVLFDHPPLVAGRGAELSFTLRDSSTGNAVTDVEIMHERPMHVILVRDDLKHFDHIHPQQDGERWVVPYTFTAGGHYRIWIDFMKKMQHVVDFDVDVTGPDAGEPDRLQGLRVEMERKGKIFQFVVKDADNSSVPVTDSFLGAAAHLVTIDSTLEDFGHAHDDQMDGDSLFMFTPTFSRPGLHAAWVQFSVDGQERTAAFSFSVDEA